MVLQLPPLKNFTLVFRGRKHKGAPRALAMDFLGGTTMVLQLPPLKNFTVAFFYV